MAQLQTQIADLVPNPTVLSNIVTKTFKTENAVLTSGVAVTGPEVDILMTGGSYKQELNFINKVDSSVFNYSSDDFEEKGATGKITASAYTVLRHDLNWGWTYTDLVRLITKYDVRGGLVAAIPAYWSEVSENIAVASMKGALAATTQLTTGAGTDPFDIDFIIDAGSTLSDPRSPKVWYIGRKVLARLQKMNQHQYAAAETDLGFATFAGNRLVITEEFGDDTVVIAEDGALAFGAGVIPGQIGMEIARDANAGNGGGGEILRTRLSMVTAPQGHSYTGPEKPGLVGLANPANWNMVADIKDVGFRAFKFDPSL